MDEELREVPHTQPIEKVARKSRNTLVVLQVVMACLMGAMMFALIIGGLVINENRVRLQQQVAINTQDRLRVATAVQLQKQEQQRVTSALCDNQFTIATAPVPINATRILVQFVESSRKAFVLLQCRGRLPAPSSNLVVASRKQDVPLRY